MKQSYYIKSAVWGSIAMILALLPFGKTHAQIANMNIEWQDDLGGSGYNTLSGVAATVDGGYIVCGSSTSGISGDKTDTCIGNADYWIVKLSAAGTIQWQKTIGGTGADYATSIVQTSDSGYIVGGSSNSGISGDKTDTCRGADDYWLLKLDDTGAIQWQKTLGGSGEESLTQVGQTADGGYLVAGYSSSEISGDKTDSNRDVNEITNDCWIVKLSATGAIQWQKTIGGSDDDQLWSFVQTSDGGFLLGSGSTSPISGEKTVAPIDYSYDFWAVKIDDTGAIQWQKVYGGSDYDALQSIAVAPTGGYMLFGLSFSGISGNKTDTCRGSGDYWAVKVDDTGAIQWQKTIGGSGYDDGVSVIATVDSGFLLGGSSNSLNDGDKLEAGWGSNDYWLIKLNKNGGMQWQKDLGGTANDELGNSNDGMNICLQADGSYFIGGSSASGIGGDKTDTSFSGLLDYWVLRVKPLCSGDTGHIAAQICPGSGYQLVGGNTVFAPGSYNSFFVTSGGCDSLVQTVLTAVVIDTVVSHSGSTLTVQPTTGATYQWIDCGSGNAITGATNASYTPNANGSYSIAVTANGCTDTSACHTISNTGIEQVNLSRYVVVYPNPAYDKVTITSKGGAALQSITIVNMLGSVVFTQLATSDSQTIDLQHLPSGIYTVTINTDKGVAITKVDLAH